MSTESAPLLPLASLISGSSTDSVAVLTVVVSPLTVRLPAIVTLLGKPTVIAPVEAETSTSLAVPVSEVTPATALILSSIAADVIKDVSLSAKDSPDV